MIPAVVSRRHEQVMIPASGKLCTLFAHARRVRHQGRDWLVVPHNPEETRVLRNLGVDVPPPVLAQYDWAGGKPFDVQRKTVAMLTQEPRAYVLNGMGTGKTKSALWAFDYLRSKGHAHRMLVVAPLSTLDFVWRREAFSTVPHLNVVTLHGSREVRLNRLQADADIYVINHDGLRVIEGELAKRDDIDVICIDELASFRNATAVRSKTLARISASRPRVWGLTGSPTPNEPTDVYGQARIVTPWTVGKSFVHFRDQLMQKQGAFRWIPKPGATERAKEVLTPSVRFTLDDVVELPELVMQTTDVQLTPEVKKAYDQLEKESFLALDAGQVTAVNEGVLIGKLLQTSLGYIYTNDGKVAAVDSSDRYNTLIDVLDATDRKVLVFAPYRHTIAALAANLERDGYSVAQIHGGVAQTERNKIFTAFQSDTDPKVIVAQPGTMAHGVTLTEAATIVWYGPTASLEIFQQANARITRVGQKHKQLVVMLQATPAERRMYRILQRKDRQQASLLDLLRSE